MKQILNNIQFPLTHPSAPSMGSWMQLWCFHFSPWCWLSSCFLLLHGPFLYLPPRPAVPLSNVFVDTIPGISLFWRDPTGHSWRVALSFLVKFLLLSTVSLIPLDRNFHMAFWSNFNVALKMFTFPAQISSYFLVGVPKASRTLMMTGSCKAISLVSHPMLLIVVSFPWNYN